MIKMAVFGTQNTIRRIQEIISDVEEVEMLPFIYSEAEETTNLLDTVFNCDIYVFTEYLSYLYVKDTIEKKRLPALRVEMDPYMMAANLYRLETKMDHPPSRVALDAFNETFLDEVTQELGLDDDIHSFLHDEWTKPDINRLVSYYITLWTEDKVDYILPSSEEITAKLTAKGIPAHTMEIPELQLKQLIDQAISLVRLSESENRQMVTGYVSVKGIDANTEIIGHSLDILNKVRRILTKFTAKNDASFVKTSENHFVIYGSEKLLKHLKEHYRSFPLLQEMKSNIKLPIHLGFGLGLSANESAKNAEIALDSCKRSDHSICYIVNERQEMIGPIGVKKEIDTSSLYQALIHDARLNNELSYNFIDFITDRNNEPFSTHDVALFYKVTKRSAERTVNKLLSGNVIKIAGEERPYKKGRPRKLFTLNQ
ncbi:hypothetical protein M3210_10590 [Oceanobacillus luteolus]|uniref:hypothetical protein n=1 Tax=Oceanobacillus luteolus TaxID=1274358 RepID=UPI00203DAA22|nr:hypothetical protein [Oceanobacillus luteolus]MCM3740720.1 hypothetical protein [Oceanobacillus luteolus]